MPQVKGYGNIRVPNSQIAKLKQVYEHKKHELLDSGITSLSGMVQQNLNDLIESDEKMRQYAPYLEQGSIELNRFVVKDAKQDRLVDVFLQDNVLFCDLDQSTDCVHIGYVWSLPQIYKALKARGMKPK